MKDEVLNGGLYFLRLYLHVLLYIPRLMYVPTTPATHDPNVHAIECASSHWS